MTQNNIVENIYKTNWLPLFAGIISGYQMSGELNPEECLHHQQTFI